MDLQKPEQATILLQFLVTYKINHLHLEQHNRNANEYLSHNWIINDNILDVDNDCFYQCQPGEITGVEKSGCLFVELHI